MMTDNSGASYRRKTRTITPWEMRAQRAALRSEIAAVLRERGNAWMTPEDIAAAVNDRGNCSHPDGGEVTIQQICRQTRNYANIFERTCTSIRLREP